MQNVEYVNCYFFASEEEYNTHECLFEFMTDRQTGFVKSAKQS